MNSTDYPAPGRGRRRVVLVVLLALGLPLVLLFASYLGYRMSNSSAVARLEKKARARGEPMTLAEIEKGLPPLADADNAAVALLELWKEEDEEFWQAFIDGRKPTTERKSREVDPKVPVVGLKAEKVSRTNGLSAAGLAAGTAHLREQADYLVKLRAALRRPECRFPLKLSDGYVTLLPHLAGIKGEAQLFRLEALVATERGDADTAITALTNAARMGELLAQEPFLISHLVRLACGTIALQGAEHLMSRRELTAAQLTRVEALLAQLKMEGGLKTSYVGERATALSVFDRPGMLSSIALIDGAGNVDLFGQRAGKGLLNVLGLSGADKRLMLETYDTVLAEVESETPEAIARRQKVFDDAMLEARRFPPKIFSGLTLGALSKVGVRFASFEARRRAGLAAAAVERHRLANGGKLPADLPALVPRQLTEAPADPYNGQPLRFRAGARGYVIYSVGPDLQDNDGEERPAGAVKVGKDYDEPFTVAR